MEPINELDIARYVFHCEKYKADWKIHPRKIQQFNASVWIEIIASKTIHASAKAFLKELSQDIYNNLWHDDPGLNRIPELAPQQDWSEEEVAAIRQHFQNHPRSNQKATVIFMEFYLLCKFPHDRLMRLVFSELLDTRDTGAANSYC